MANLSQEVFDEVMEHEMALARLEDADLSELIPGDSAGPQRKSMLLRLNSLQHSLKSKQRNGLAPRFTSDELIENSSLASSILEEDSKAEAGEGS